MAWSRGGTPATHADVQAVVANLRGATFDVRDYGATGDGSTNDTVACQAAITAAQATGGVVLFQPGTYMIDTLYITANNIHIQGSGRSATVLRHRPGTSVDSRMLAFNSTGSGVSATPGSYLTDLSVSDLMLDNNNANVTANSVSSTVVGTIGVQICKRVAVHNVYVLNPVESGICAGGCIDLEISGVVVDGMIGVSQVNSININGDTWNGSPGYTVNVSPCYGVRVYGCRVINNAANGGFGICIQAATDVAVVDTLVDLTSGGRTGYGIIFEGGGVTAASEVGADYTISGCGVTGCAYGVGGIDTSGQAVTTGILSNYTITGCEIYNCVNGIVLNGSNLTAVGNSVSADNCISVGANKASVESNITIVGNTLQPQAGVGIGVNKQTASGRVDGLMITGNTIDGVSQGSTGNPGIIFFGACHNFMISNNIIKNMPGSGIYLNTLSSTLRCEVGRITNNLLLNVCNQASGLSFPENYGIASGGCLDVLVALNYIVGGAGLSSHTGNTTTPALTIFANRTTSNVTATDASNSSARIGGTVTGSKAANAALTSLLTALAGLQIVTDSST